MQNLLDETREKLNSFGKVPGDVRWVGNNYVWFTWDEFVAIANVDYDDGYGGNEVCGGLMVVGDDWWLERGEYDGSEWWTLKCQPKKPEQKVVPISVLVENYDDKITY